MNFAKKPLLAFNWSTNMYVINKKKISIVLLMKLTIFKGRLYLNLDVFTSAPQKLILFYPSLTWPDLTSPPDLT